MINKVVLVGRLTKDPELRYTPSGVAMARFTLAVNRTFASQNGEREADFINCIVWRKTAENTANFTKKGSLVGIDGRIQTGSYEGQDGKRVYTTDVVCDSVQFLEPRGTTEGRESAGGTNTQGNNQNGDSGQPQTNNHQRSQSEYQQNNNQQNYSRVDEDPFSNSSGPIEVSDDDLPF